MMIEVETSKIPRLTGSRNSPNVSPVKLASPLPTHYRGMNQFNSPETPFVDSNQAECTRLREIIVRCEKELKELRDFANLERSSLQQALNEQISIKEVETKKINELENLNLQLITVICDREKTIEDINNKIDLLQSENNSLQHVCDQNIGISDNTSQNGKENMSLNSLSESFRVFKHLNTGKTIDDSKLSFEENKNQMKKMMIMDHTM